MKLLRSRDHEAIEARVHFGGRTTDKENTAFAAKEGAVYVTGDWRFVRPRRFDPRHSAVLVLHSLYGEQVERVTDLAEDVEGEARRMRAGFLIVIRTREYAVQR